MSDVAASVSVIVPAYNAEQYLERAVDFYGNTLGLQRSVYMPERHFAEFETGNMTLNLMNSEAMGLEHNTLRNALALHVDDVFLAVSF